MSSDDIQRQMEFILGHQAKFSADVDRLTEEISGLKDVQKQQAENINKLTEATASTQAQLDSVISEMRDGFDKLILSNDVTRDFANKIASLEVQTSHRVTGLEHRVTDLESKQ